MAIPCGINTLNQQSYVECPDSSGLPARRVKICNPEDISSSTFLPDNVDPLNEYGEVTSVAIASETDVLSYTVPVGKLVSISYIEVSGDNIGTYRVKLNNVTTAKKRTSVGGAPNEVFPFDRYELSAGDVIKITVENCSFDSLAGDFEARINGIIGDA